MENNDRILTIDELNISEIKAIAIQKHPRGRKQRGKRRCYKDIITAFDIETTRLPEIEQSIMYIWQWHFDGFGTVIGRTWDEFRTLSERLQRTCIKSKNQHIVVFVHNLSYEFQFMQGVVKFEQEDVFAIQPRKVLKCDIGCLEFRCSYIHSNMSLSQYLREMGVPDQKQTGFDYTKRRFPWTKLSKKELLYCINDVKGLVEAIKVDMNIDNDDIRTFPLTATGYVRRDAKEAMQRMNNGFFVDIQLDLYEYDLLRAGFRGGDCHANRHYQGVILENVKSQDRVSSYPEVLMNRHYPRGKWRHFGELSFAELAHLIYARNKAVVFRCVMTNVRLKDPHYGNPYLSASKCEYLDRAVRDNGRVLQADMLATTLTDIDLKIVMDIYDWDSIAITNGMYSNYARLPEPFKECIREYYNKKTKLKGVSTAKLEYARAKAKLNSLYGMCAQDPIKVDIVYDSGLWGFEDNANRQEILDDYNKRVFLPYSWGVWCTAWARYSLHVAVLAAGDKFVYCDTDSVKTIGELDLSEFNTDREEASIYNEAYADDPSGTRHYMGVYEPDETYARFITMGAKKYAYQEEPGGPSHVTVSGVVKSKGGAELDKAGGLEAFRYGFEFSEAGGVEARYNDSPYGKYIVDGHTIEITPNVVLRDSTYTLGLTDEYERICNQAKFMLDNMCI